MEIQIIDKNIANVIASGSTGNCEIYMGYAAIDMGVSYSLIKPYVSDLKIVLLSHEHIDHLNINTIRRLAADRPTLRFACGEWLKDKLSGIKKLDVLELNKWYDYGAFKVSIGKAYHDVPNAFFRLDFSGYKIFRATDTAHLDGIEAKDYDLYAIEHNYNEETIHEVIATLEARGQFAYMKGSLNSHLSEQQARDFFYRNKGEHSQLIRLHETRFVL